MSTNAGATDSNSDAVVSSELATDSLDTKTETLAIEPSSGGSVVQDLVDVDDARVSGGELGVVMDKDVSNDEVRVSGGEIGIVIENSELVQDLGDEARVSRDEVGIVMDKGEKVLDESRLVAVVSSVSPAASDVVKIGDGSLDSKTLAAELSSGGIVVQDLVDDAVVSSVPPAASDEVKIGDVSIDSKTLAAEPSSGGIVVQDLVDDARVSYVPPAASDEVKIGDGSIDSKTETLATDPSSGGIVVQDSVDGARVSSVPPAVNDEVKIGDDLLESKSGTPIVETSDQDVGGDIIAQDLGDEARVSEVGISMDKDGKLLDESSLDAAGSSVPPAADDEVKIGAELLESKSETLILETSVDDARVSADHNGVSDIVVQESVDGYMASRDDKVIIMENIEKVSDENEVRNEEQEGECKVFQNSVTDTSVSADETGILMNNSEPVLDKSISDTVIPSEPLSKEDIDTVNEVNIGTDSLGSKTETLKINPSVDHIKDQDLIDDKGIEVENIEKVADENEVDIEEKEGEYKVTDIVWAKVKDYPWWPGQILDPSFSTDKAKKHSNKKGLLVGYFGDQSFAWNKPSNIKHFRKNFSKLAKQSNSKAFFHAVDCALDEVSRRVDFGLACSCLSKEVYDKIKSQEFVNAGITKEASKIDGGDRFSIASSFEPVKVVQSVQELAKEQFDGFDRLEVLSVRTRLLAFFRWKGWKGCYQFQAVNFLEDLSNKLADESEVPLTEDIKAVEDEKPASVNKKVKSIKRKLDVSDSDDSEDSVPKGNSSAKRSKKGISKKTTSAGKNVSSKKRKPDVSDSDDSDDSAPHKKEASLEKMTQKGGSNVKRSKKDISKKTSVKDNGNEKAVSGGKKVSSKKRKPDVSDSDDSEDSVPRKKEKSMTNVTSKGNSSVERSKQSISKKGTVEDSKKVTSKKQKPDVSDSDDSEDSVPRKKERSVADVTPKGDSSVKRIKQCISKKATVEDHGNEKTVSGGKKVSSKNMKPDVSDSDDSVPRKKGNTLTNKASKADSSVKRSKKRVSKKEAAEDNGNGTRDKKSSNSSPKKLFRVGDRICRIVKQISESPSGLKNESEKSKNDDDEESS